MRWFFKTQAEKRHEIEQREYKALDREIRREANYYARLIPDVLARMGVDHWLPRADRPSIIESKILGIEGRQKVKIVKVNYDENVIDLWVDSRFLPYRSDLSRLHTEEVLETLTDACGRKVVWINEIGCGAWYQIWRNGAVNAIPREIGFNAILNEIPDNAPPLFFIAGVTVNNLLKRVDLAAMPHYLVAGSTFTGKSVHLNQLLCQIIRRNSPAKVQFMMIDLKRGAEFAAYEKLPHLWQPIVKRMEDVPDALCTFRDEMDRRMDAIAEKGLTNLSQYNQLYPEDARPLIVLVFDELGLIMGHDDRKLVKAATAHLNAILATSRSAGGHAILCTQRPSADVIAPYIKANAAGRVCFAVPSNTDSIVVIDSGAASKIDREIPGRAILSVGPWLAEIQSPNISSHQIAQIIKEARGEHVAVLRSAAMTVDDVLRLSVREFGGKLNYKVMFEAVRGKIDRSDLQALMNELNGGNYIVDGVTYRVKNAGRGIHGGKHLERVGHVMPHRETDKMLKGAMPVGVDGEPIAVPVSTSDVESIKG